MSEYEIVLERYEYVVKDSTGEIIQKGFRIPFYAINWLYASFRIGSEEYHKLLEEFGYAD